MDSNESGYKAIGETKDSNCAFDSIWGLALTVAELPTPPFDCPPAHAPSNKVTATLIAMQMVFLGVAIMILWSIIFSARQMNKLFCHLRDDFTG
jgi:hypothetical protein